MGSSYACSNSVRLILIVRDRSLLLSGGSSIRKLRPVEEKYAWQATLHTGAKLSMDRICSACSLAVARAAASKALERPFASKTYHAPVFDSPIRSGRDSPWAATI